MKDINDKIFYVLMFLFIVCVGIILLFTPNAFGWITVGNYDYSISDYYYLDYDNSSYNLLNITTTKPDIDYLYVNGQEYGDWLLKDNVIVFSYELYNNPLLIDVFRSVYVNNSNYDVFDSDYQVLAFSVSLSNMSWQGFGDNVVLYHEFGDNVTSFNLNPLDSQQLEQMNNTVYDITRFDNYDYYYFNFVITTDENNVNTQNYVLNLLSKAFYLSNRYIDNILNENYGSGDYNDGYRQGHSDGFNEGSIDGYNNARSIFGYWNGSEWLTASVWSQMRYDSAKEQYGLYYSGVWQTASFMYELGKTESSDFSVSILQVISYVFAGLWGIFLTVATMPISTFGFTLMDIILIFGALQLLTIILRRLGNT